MQTVEAMLLCALIETLATWLVGHKGCGLSILRPDSDIFGDRYLTNTNLKPTYFVSMQQYLKPIHSSNRTLIDQ